MIQKDAMAKIVWQSLISGKVMGYVIYVTEIVDSTVFLAYDRVQR